MSIYRESQRIGQSLIGICQKVTLRYNTDHWEVNKWDGVGWIDLTDTAKYVPEFSVRTLKIVGTVGSSAVVEYDLAGYSNNVVKEDTVTIYEKNIIDTFATLQVYVERVTAVYLVGSSTTATQICLGS